MFNGAAKIARLLHPGIPVISNKHLEKAKKFVMQENSDFIGIAKHSNLKQTMRGADLRDLENFLGEKDPESSFCGLKRICDEGRNAIWVTEESSNEIMAEQEQQVRNNIESKTKIDELKSKVKELKTKKKEWKTEKKELKTENEELMKEIEKLKTENALLKNRCKCSIP